MLRVMARLLRLDRLEGLLFNGRILGRGSKKKGIALKVNSSDKIGD